MAAFDEQEYTKSFDLKIWKRLTPLLAPYKMAFVGMFAFNALCALVDVVLPLFQRYAIGNFIEAGTLQGLVPYGLCYLAVILLQALSVVAFSRNSMHIEMSVGRDMRRVLFTHLQTLSFSFYNVTPVGYILTRVMSDTNRIASMIAWNMTDILWAMFYVFGTFAAMLVLNWRLALVVILIVPAIAVLTGYFQNRILHWNRKVRKINSQITGAFNEGITGAKTSKTLVIEDQNTESFRTLTKSMHDAGIRAARLNAVYIPLVLFFSTLAVAIVLLRGGYMVQQQVLEIATLSAFTSYAVGIFEPIQMTAANIAEFISLQASIERVTGLMDQIPQVRDTPEVEARYGDVFHPKTENWEPLLGEIEFRDVTFRYPDGGENVLEHFSLHIPAGTTVAIVGETGAGKSTLVNLACRFFEPTEGQILIDGRDYRDRSQLWLHSNIGYVLQNPHLFSGSVRENIRYGRLDATDEEVIAAAKAANADHFIRTLPGGYQMELNEDASNVSQGQKQLLTIARAILADNKILILDEATSSVDTRTEQRIQTAMDNLMRGRTSFVIAHRLSTIKDADLILVMRDGDIVEQGTHDDLLAAGGFYADLYNSQFEDVSA